MWGRGYRWAGLDCLAMEEVAHTQIGRGSGGKDSDKFNIRSKAGMAAAADRAASWCWAAGKG